MPRLQRPLAEQLDLVVDLGRLGERMTDDEVTRLMELVPPAFQLLVTSAGFPDRLVRAVMTKFRDAGRRTPPTRVFSTIGPGRPQNAADGNRTNRWLLPGDHKFFATKRDAELVEIRFYLQCLSMFEAPSVPRTQFRSAFFWLLGHECSPGEYLDPIMLRDIHFPSFLHQPRRVESGHYTPLARGGQHTYDNTFLMLKRSNAMQSDLTFEELLALFDDILRRQSEFGINADPANLPPHALLEEPQGGLSE